MDNQNKRKYVNNAVFSLILIVGFFIISLICITDCCLIKSNCIQNNAQDTTALYQKSVEIDSSSKTIQFSSNNSNITTAKTDTVITTQEKNTTSTSNNNPASLDSIVFNLTLAVNAINNVLSGGAIALGILTLFIGLVGLFGYNTLKEDIREYKLKHDKDTQKTIEELESQLTRDYDEFTTNQNNIFVELKRTTDEHTNKINTKLENFYVTIHDYSNKVDLYAHLIDDIRKALTQQARYIDQTINIFFKATYSNISQMKDKEQANLLLANLFHDFQIAKLYRNNFETDEVSDIDVNLITALEYLEENGTMEDIPHLEYVAQNDTNDDNRNRARMIIGRIMERSRQ